MSRDVSTNIDGVLTVEELERAWNGPNSGDGLSPARLNRAQLTITRHGASDFQDRQVYLFVDEEPWGKVRYGTTVSREIAPGRHRVRAFNTLFSHTIEVNALPGEHVRLHCTNGMPAIGWLMMMFLHVTALRPRLEREK
jgi:hypothetical protein